MKISAIIPSRGRNGLLVGCVHTFARLTSTKHEVTFVICADLDDSPTIAAAFDLRTMFPNVAVRVSDRRPALGSYYNEACVAHPADAYCAIGDDTLCTKPDWDDAIAQAVAGTPNGLWWWSCEGERQAIYPIQSHAWYKAAGRFFTDLFPFWFDDVWLREIAVMVTGKEVPRIEGARLVDTVTRTTRMYDLGFWDDFYQATRLARVSEARKVSAALGMPAELVNQMAVQLGPNKEFRATADQVVEIQGDTAPPSPGYLQAKARAERVLARIAMIQMQAA